MNKKKFTCQNLYILIALIEIQFASAVSEMSSNDGILTNFSILSGFSYFFLNVIYVLAASTGISAHSYNFILKSTLMNGHFF